MLVVVGRVCEVALNDPFRSPTIIKPFMLVIEALIAMLLSPDIGLWMVKVGVENT
jgi:hypothetical protein